MRREVLHVSRLCVRSFALCIDGYGAGPRQDLHNPIGVRGTELMEWFFATRLWRRMHGYQCMKSVAGERANPRFLRRATS